MSIECKKQFFSVMKLHMPGSDAETLDSELLRTLLYSPAEGNLIT